MTTINNCSREFIVKTTNRKKRTLTAPKEKPKAKTKVVRERKRSREEPHEIFLTLKAHAAKRDDQTWEEIFDLASKDEFPKNMKYHGGQLCFKYKNHNHELPLGEKDIDILYDAVKKFYQQNIGIFSQKEIEDIKNKIEEYYSSLPKKDLKWNDMAKLGKLKMERMIRKYALNVCSDKDKADSLIAATKMKMYCGNKATEGGFEMEKDELVDVKGIFVDGSGLYRLSECKIPKIVNQEVVHCDIDSVSTSTEAPKNKNIKKSNLVKYLERISNICTSTQGAKEIITTTKRQTKRQR